MGNTFKNPDQENKTKLLVAIGVSMMFLTIWQFFFAPTEEELNKQKNTNIQQVSQQQSKQIQAQAMPISNKYELAKPKKNVYLETEKTKIGIDVNNNIINFFELKDYKKHEGSLQNIILLDDEHFINDNWIFIDDKIENINWKLGAKTKNSISIIGANSKYNLETTYTIDENYMINITQKITNKSGKEQQVAHFVRASLLDTKDRVENSYAYRGILVMNEGNINELAYDKIQKQDIYFENSTKQGWIALSDQYWLTALINQNKTNNKTNYSARYNKDKNSYQIDFNDKDFIHLESGKTLTKQTSLYVGPKKLDILQHIGDKYKLEKFDKAIDFGMFYFISKPLLIILKKLYKISGNFGLAIILLTILVRMIIFPLANRSYRATAKMKLLAPEMKAIKEKYKDGDQAANRKAIQEETMQLYRKYNINPMSAIFPMFLQIPIFFALYKVLVISIEMRDAPFIGWIVDLSSADPSSFVNLFGLLPFEAPQILQIGLLPCIMGFTMLIQQKLTPNVSMDKTQQKIMNWLPAIFTFMFAGMPAGLVLYWSCSNVFSIIQQSVLLKLVNKNTK